MNRAPSFPLLALVLLVTPARVTALDLDYTATSASGAAAGAAGALVLSARLAPVAPGSSRWSWSKVDVALEAGFAAVALLDMLQTLQFRHEGFTENNPLLGRTPSDSEVVWGIAASVATHALISAALPHPWRALWQGAGLGVELAATSRNFALGAGLRLPL